MRRCGEGAADKEPAEAWPPPAAPLAAGLVTAWFPANLALMAARLTVAPGITMGAGEDWLAPPPLRAPGRVLVAVLVGGFSANAFARSEILRDFAAADSVAAPFRGNGAGAAAP